jgi:broad specificity phosphatase PhoE
VSPASDARRWIFITHANVLIDPKVPVPEWPLSPRGRQRMRIGLRQPWVTELTAVYSSRERKAIDGAQLLADHCGLPLTTRAELGENDRSATGFLPPPQFERMADAFFARPHESVRGWERAADAQARIVAAVQAIDRDERSGGAIAIVSHGAVGTLLHCWLSGRDISRRWDQPGNGGGNWYAFTLEPRQALGHWQPLDEPTPLKAAGA